jgi:hypothetical protein
LKREDSEEPDLWLSALRPRLSALGSPLRRSFLIGILGVC